MTHPGGTSQVERWFSALPTKKLQRTAHRSVLTTEANLTLLRKTVDQARRNLELINGSLEVGFSTITEVRLAQDDLFSAETRYNNALLNYQVALAELYVALGLPLY